MLALITLIKVISGVHVMCLGNIQQTLKWFLQHLAVVDGCGFHVNSSSPLLGSHTLPGTMTLEPCTLQLFMSVLHAHLCASCVHFLGHDWNAETEISGLDPVSLEHHCINTILQLKARWLILIFFSLSLFPIFISSSHPQFVSIFPGDCLLLPPSLSLDNGCHSPTKCRFYLLLIKLISLGTF